MAALGRRQEGTEFGAYVRQLRLERKMSQQQVADRLGTSLTYYNKIERGLLPPPSAAMIDGLAEVLEADRDELYARAGKVPPEVLEALKGRAELFALVRAAEPLRAERVRELIAWVREMGGRR